MRKGNRSNAQGFTLFVANFLEMPEIFYINQPVWISMGANQGKNVRTYVEFGRCLAWMHSVRRDCGMWELKL